MRLSVILSMSIIFDILNADQDVDAVLRDVQGSLQRYKHVEVEIAQRRQRLAVKQPEIEKCLDAVNLLIERKESEDDVRCTYSVYEALPWFMKD